MSKKYFAAILLTAFLFGVGHSVSAQERELTAQEYKTVEATAFGRLKGKTYRMTRTSENFIDRNAEPRSVNKTISEFTPKGRRFVSELKSPVRNSKFESVWIGEKGYQRKDDGPWEEIRKGEGSGNGAGVSTERPVLVRESYRFVEKGFLDERAVSIYESTRQYSAPKTGRETNHKSRLWIAENGHVLKIQTDMETTGDKSLLRMTTVYDYDENLKIEEPVLAGEVKTQ